MKILLPPIEVIPNDFKTPLTEIKAKSYDWHWLGGLIVTAIIFLITNFNYAYFFALGINAMIWALKEFIWFTAFTFEKHFAFLRWLRKFKVFQWSEPDWKDWRFSVYGSLPFTALIYLLTNKNK